tara:strand:- start:196 stop:429 length:234 start_codon:yes stop_codon:yes gene_type:complete
MTPNKLGITILLVIAGGLTLIVIILVNAVEAKASIIKAVCHNEDCVTLIPEGKVGAPTNEETIDIWWNRFCNQTEEC